MAEGVQAPAKKKVRSSDIEALRIVAMLAIIFFHFTYHGIRGPLNATLAPGSVADAVTWEVFFAHLIGWCGDFGNSLFMMITGYFVIKGRVNWKKNFLLACAMLFYAWIILAGVLHWNLLELSSKEIWDEILPFFRGENWFVSCYLVFSFFIPFINRFLTSLDRRDYKVFTLLMFLFYSVLPKMDVTTYFAGNKLLYFLLVYAAGGYLRLHADKSPECHGRYRKWFYGLLALMIFTVILYDALGAFLEDPYFVKDADGFRKVIPIPMAAMLFGCVVTRGKSFYSAGVNKVAGTMLGVYLIHDNILLRELLWNHFYPNFDFITSPMFPLFTIGKCLSVFVMCAAIELLRKALMEAPLEKVVDRYWDSWAAFFAEKFSIN